MEFARRWMAQIQTLARELSVSQKLAIGTTIILMGVVLFLVVSYAGSPTMVAVLDQPLSAEQRARIVGYLKAAGIEYDVVGSRVLVPAQRQLEAVSRLQLQNLLPRDITRAFDALIEQQSWWQSSEQNDRAYTIAKQKVLGRIIAAYPWVERATVIISMPQQRGFGAATQRPEASVNVVMSSGRLDQAKVGAIAGLVSGAVAEMRPEDVTVIDALAGKQWKPGRDNQMAPGNYLDYVRAQEEYYRAKIMDALRYIGGVIVAVSVRVDLSSKRIQTRYYDPDKSVTLPTREFTREQKTTGSSAGGAPGVRANVGTTIVSATGGGRTTSIEETETEYEPYPGTKRTQSFHPGGVPKSISATVNVPRSYFVSLYRREHGSDAPAPSDAELAPLIEEHLQRIREQVVALVSATDAGEVVVNTYPDVGPPTMMDAASAEAGAGGVGEVLLRKGVMEKVGLGVLALTAVASMLLMVRKASRRTPLPGGQELTGAPPPPQQDEEDEDADLPAVEIDDATRRERRMTEEVGSMVKQDPQEAAAFLNRWVRQ